MTGNQTASSDEAEIGIAGELISLVTEYAAELRAGGVTDHHRESVYSDIIGAVYAMGSAAGLTELSGGRVARRDGGSMRKRFLRIDNQTEPYHLEIAGWGSIPPGTECLARSSSGERCVVLIVKKVNHIGSTSNHAGGVYEAKILHRLPEPKIDVIDTPSLFRKE